MIWRRRGIAIWAILMTAPGLADERTLTLTDFDRVRIEGSYVVDIVTGRGPSGRMSGTAQALDRVRVDVSANTLIVRPRPGASGGYPGEAMGPVRIRVTTPALRSAWLSGSGTLNIAGMRGASLDLALSGSGAIDVRAIDADALRVAISGAGQATLAGRVAQAAMIVRGSGTLDAAALAAQDLRLTSDGSGDTKASASRSANITASGSGTVIVSGPAACAVNNRGAGTVRCGAR